MRRPIVRVSSGLAAPAARTTASAPMSPSEPMISRDRRPIGVEPGHRCAEMERHPEPRHASARPTANRCGSPGAVGRIVNRAGEPATAVTKRGFECDRPVVVQNVLAPAVILQEPRVPFGDTQFILVVEQIEHSAVGLPELQVFAGRQHVHQLLAVAGESQLRQRVGPRPRWRALPDELEAPTARRSASARGRTRMDVASPSNDFTSIAGAFGDAHAYECPGAIRPAVLARGIRCDVTSAVVDVHLVPPFGQGVGRGDADDSGAEDGDLQNSCAGTSHRGSR